VELSKPPYFYAIYNRSGLSKATYYLCFGSLYLRFLLYVKERIANIRIFSIRRKSVYFYLLVQIYEKYFNIKKRWFVYV